jgi:hypothetical protein
MPETPKVFRKKSKVKTWYNGLARETLAEDYLSERAPNGSRVPAGSVATGNTVAEFHGYPTLPSDDAESEVKMEGQQSQQPDNMAVVMGQLKQLLTKQAETDRTLANIQKKDTDQSFAKTWEESAGPETRKTPLVGS